MEPNQRLRRHKLMTAEIRKSFPKWRSTDGEGMDAIVRVKYFAPGRYTFYVTEFDGDDTLFGYTVSPLGPDCDEWGYQSLRELFEMMIGPMPAIERDCWFDPQPLKEALKS